MRCHYMILNFMKIFTGQMESMYRRGMHVYFTADIHETDKQKKAYSCSSAVRSFNGCEKADLQPFRSSVYRIGQNKSILLCSYSKGSKV